MQQRILLLCTDEELDSLFANCFKDSGHIVNMVENPKNISNILANEQYDILLINIGASGDSDWIFELVKKIKNDLKTARLHVVVLIFKKDSKRIVDAIEAGVDSFIFKPFDTATFFRSVENVIESASSKRDQKEIESLYLELNDKNKKRASELSVFCEIINAVSYTLDFEQLLKLILESLFKIVDYDICSSLVYDEKDAQITIKPVYGQVSQFVDDVRANIVEYYSKMTGESLRGKQLSAFLIPPDGDILIDEGRVFDKLRSFLNVPFIINGKIKGMINVSSCRENAFGEEEINLINTIARQACNAVERLETVINVEKSKMESMVESMKEGVVMIDERGDVIIINPQARQMLGFGLKEEITREVFERKMLSVGLSVAFRECQAKERTVTKEIASSFDENQVLQCNVLPVTGEDVGVIGIVAILRDITKEKEIDRMKTEFISTVSHELRTPLSITKEGLSLILDKIPGNINKKQEKILGTAKDSIDRLARIINNLLDISKIESGKVELKRGLVNISALAKHTSLFFEPKAKEKGLKLKLNLPKSEVNAYADADRIIQVFTNLIGNAIKFTEEGSIEISAIEKENEVECIVKDTGRGISKTDLPKVFNKFQQFGRVEGAGEKGTGLGLSIAHKIIDMHNGKIWVESEAEQGSKFTFILPKYTVEVSLKEFINNGIREAIEKDTKVSLIAVLVTDFNKLIKKFSMIKANEILKGMKNRIENSLCPSGDIVIKNTGEIDIILANCDRENAVRVMGQVEELLGEYLEENKLQDKTQVRIGSATYPDEALSDEELLKKAKGM